MLHISCGKWVLMNARPGGLDVAYMLWVNGLK